MKCSYLLPLLGVLFLSSLTTACETIKPYEKEYLLDPLMDDAAVTRLKPSMIAASTAPFEKLATAASATSESSSCPTCGG